MLDLVTGGPAAGLRVVARRCDGDREPLRGEAATDTEGRVATLLPAGRLPRGTYELEFAVGAYFARSGAAGGFLDVVPVRFLVTDPDADYHVPLLVSPWAYTAYRGT